MVTSMLPGHFVMVPERVVNFCQQQPHVHSNRRLVQRPERVPRIITHDGIFVEERMRIFLKSLSLPAPVVMLFQGYGREDIGTTVILLKSIHWFGTLDDYPRLDFDHPPLLKQIHGCPDFWGAFIMAMAQVPYQKFCAADPEGLQFIRICTEAIRMQYDDELARR
ncbi:MAG TPA: hypothetical protein VF974_03160 [Patescibacteria group bacterium]